MERLSLLTTGLFLAMIYVLLSSAGESMAAPPPGKTGNDPKAGPGSEVPREGPYSNENAEEEDLTALGQDNAWESFKKRNGKSYKSKAVHDKRKSIFSKHWNFVKQHKAKKAKGEATFTVELNEYADMAPEEFTVRNGNVGNFTKDYATYSDTAATGSTGSALPATVDWRSQGYVTPVKNQYNCGSCWAFSVTGVLEGQNFKYKNKLVSLSEQQLVDCTIYYGNDGCDGGSAAYAYPYVDDSGGLNETPYYPYTGVTSYCQPGPLTFAGVLVTGYVVLPSGDEEVLRRAVATYGPIAAAMDGSQLSLQFYKGGIYYEPLCQQTHNHAVLVVGYGSSNGSDYWIIKNSWSSRWGVNGYLYLARNRNGHCGITTFINYPIVK